jgi:hypothetical protein
MQLLTLDRGQAQRLFWSLAVVSAAVGALTIRQTDPVLVGAAVLVTVVGLAPFYIWLLGTREGLPIWPAFSLYACTLSAMPALQNSAALERFPSGAVLTSLLTMAVFFALGTAIWASVVAPLVKPPEQVLMLNTNTAVRSLMWCVLVGALFQLNSITGLVSFPGNTMQIARGVSGGLSFLGIFAMAYFHGRGQLSSWQISAYLGLTTLLASIALTGLMIANIVQPVSLAVIGYTLGKGKPPWLVLSALFVLISVLHAGKFNMRDAYVDRGVGLASLPSFYSEWLSYGVQNLGGLEGVFGVARLEEESQTSVFERSGNLHMLVLVQHLSPEQVPFLDGLTYAPIPQMLIPRFLMPEKSISHAGNMLLSVNYGLSDADSVRNVSIGWPLIAEAYANYGYIGVIAMSILLSFGYAYTTRFSSHVPITSFRFVSGLVILASVTNENTLGVFVGAQFQAIVGVAMASFFLMRRQPNPFAAQGGAEEQWQKAEGIRRKKAEGMSGPRDQETKSRVFEPEMAPRQTARGKAEGKPKDEGRQVGPARWGGHKPPKWAPLSHRKAYELAAARRKAEAATDDIDEKNVDEGKAQRPRQVAVPIQPYYYRSRKA